MSSAGIVKAFTTVSNIVNEAEIEGEEIVTREVTKCENCGAKFNFAVAVIGSEEATNAGSFVCADCAGSIELED